MSTVLRAASKLLFGILLFVGLPLSGWGIEDLAGFFANPARLGYALVACLLQLFVVLRLPDVGNGSRQGTQIVARQRVVVALLAVLPLAIVVSAPYCDRRALAALAAPMFLRDLGVVLFAFGFLMMMWAEATLGRQFSVQVTIQPDHRLVTAGPYRYLRHPRYLGILIFALGISLVFRSGLALLLVVVMAPVLLWRIHDEEVLLHRTFGADWERYAHHSWRLLPYLY